MNTGYKCTKRGAPIAPPRADKKRLTNATNGRTEIILICCETRKLLNLLLQKELHPRERELLTQLLYTWLDKRTWKAMRRAQKLVECHDRQRPSVVCGGKGEVPTKQQNTQIKLHFTNRTLTNRKQHNMYTSNPFHQNLNFDKMIFQAHLGILQCYKKKNCSPRSISQSRPFSDFHQHKIITTEHARTDQTQKCCQWIPMLFLPIVAKKKEEICTQHWTFQDESKTKKLRRIQNKCKFGRYSIY